ncbi:MAG TPA: hypothetical protein VKV40_06735 [Ktedonobacteraceae bacterium]|nr:hypothetical protein [Ktedonobacteraceae bacterium]
MTRSREVHFDAAAGHSKPVSNLGQSVALRSQEQGTAIGNWKTSHRRADDFCSRIDYLWISLP